MKKIAISVVLALMFSLSACETMKGLGQDVQKAGKALEKKASE